MTALAGTLGILRRVCAGFAGATGCTIVAMVLVAALFAPWIATADPDQLDVMNRFAKPSLAHWLGTDHLGRDLYSRLVHGATVAMSVALTSIAIALGLGTLLGILAAYLPARLERFVLIVFDVISSFPSMVLALAIVAVFGPSTLIVVVIVAITLTPHFGRVARAQVLTLKSAPFLEAERILGASFGRIVVHHVLPNILGPLVILASMDIPVVITIEAGSVVPGPRRASAAGELGNADSGRLPVSVGQLGAGGRVQPRARIGHARLHALRRSAA